MNISDVNRLLDELLINVSYPNKNKSDLIKYIHKTLFDNFSGLIKGCCKKEDEEQQIDFANHKVQIINYITEKENKLTECNNEVETLKNNLQTKTNEWNLEKDQLTKHLEDYKLQCDERINNLSLTEQECEEEIKKLQIRRDELEQRPTWFQCDQKAKEDNRKIINDCIQLSRIANRKNARLQSELAGCKDKLKEAEQQVLPVNNQCLQRYKEEYAKLYDWFRGNIGIVNKLTREIVTLVNDYCLVLTPGLINNTWTTNNYRLWAGKKLGKSVLNLWYDFWLYYHSAKWFTTFKYYYSNPDHYARSGPIYKSVFSIVENVDKESKGIKFIWNNPEELRKLDSKVVDEDLKVGIRWGIFTRVNLHRKITNISEEQEIFTPQQLDACFTGEAVQPAIEVAPVEVDNGNGEDENTEVDVQVADDSKLIELRDANTKLVEANKQLQDTNAQLQTSNTQLQDFNAQLQNDKTKLQDEKNKLEETNKQLLEQIENYKAAKEDCDDKINDLEEKIKELEKEKNDNFNKWQELNNFWTKEPYTQEQLNQNKDLQTIGALNIGKNYANMFANIHYLRQNIVGVITDYKNRVRSNSQTITNVGYYFNYTLTKILNILNDYLGENEKTFTKSKQIPTSFLSNIRQKRETRPAAQKPEDRENIDIEIEE